MSFQNFGLSEAVVHAAQRLRYIEPTPIQEQAIPLILEGRDVIGSAQTGTGKTAAFALPLISLLGSHSVPRVLILEPTRELSAQVHEALVDFSHFTDLRTCLLHGGVRYEGQLRQIKRSPDLIVATPGRLLDHLASHALSLKTIEVVVLDEADRMLDMGFLPDVSTILKQSPSRKQTLMFSATIPPAIQTLVSWALKDPVRAEVDARCQPAETVDHALYPVASDQKQELLLALLDHIHYESVIVFTRTKAGADAIARDLEKDGHKVRAIHSDLPQSRRTAALEAFRSGEIEVLVATNIASRGLDIANVTHVFNYDMPEDPDDYIHRIGRTGRAEKTGDALTLVTGFDTDAVRAIEFLLGREIPKRKMEGFPYKYTALLEAGVPKPTRRSRRKR
jgi:ATP-dependent RNA helicase RhlE